MDRAQKFRESAARHNHGRPKSAWRYTAELRSEAVQYRRSQRRSGSTYGQIAEQLGVSTLTLSRWAKQSSATATPFHPVKVVDRPAPEMLPRSATLLSAITPSGLRIEGLAWEQVLELAEVFR